MNAGYWGKKTATVNWCEADYTVTKYVAEFGNAFSSLAIVLNGLYGIYMHWGFVELRFIVAFSSFVVVGLGSCAYHSTLLRSMQLLDELPMVWANSVFIYICAFMEDGKGHAPRIKESFAIAAVTLVMTLAVVFFDKDDQNIFLICYGGGVAYLFARSKMLDLKYNSKKQVVLLETSLLLYGGGFLLWLTDRNFCHNVRGFYLHAFWHFGAGAGTFTAVIFWIWVRHEHLGLKPVLRGTSPVTQWVEVGVKLV